MTPSEFIRFAWEVADELELVLVLNNSSLADGGREYFRDRSSLTMSQGQTANIVEFRSAHELTDLDEPPSGGSYGWVYCHTPKVFDKSLRMGRLSYTADEVTEEHAGMLPSQRRRSLFGKIRYRLKKRLHFPMWQLWLPTGAVYDDTVVGYGDDVVNWVSSGGEIQSNGTPLGRHFIQDPRLTSP